MLRTCDYCDLTDDFNSVQSWAAHRSNCIKNPNRTAKLARMSESAAKVSRKILALTCSCGSLFSIEVTDAEITRGAHRHFCSRQCANRRQHSSETKQKISQSVSRFFPESISVEVECAECKRKFVGKTGRTCCSQQCARVINNRKRMIAAQLPETRAKIAAKTLEAYANGREQCGGRTKWFDVYTLRYGKIRVQGTYEVRACQILDKMLASGELIAWEYTRARFPYVDTSGKQRMYRPDFKLVYPTHEEFVETKGFSTPNDERKWEALRLLGHHLSVWREADLKQRESKEHMS